MKDSTAQATIRFAEHIAGTLPLEVAQHFSEDPAPSPEFQARVDELASKANEGTLTQDEHDEYERYIELNQFVSLVRLNAKARCRKHSA